MTKELYMPYHVCYVSKTDVFVFRNISLVDLEE